MLKKIKEGWYVRIDKIDSLALAETGQGYKYAIEGQPYSYDCSFEEGEMLMAAIDELNQIFLDARARQLDAIDKINAAQVASKSPEVKIEEFKALVAEHSTTSKK